MKIKTGLWIFALCAVALPAYPQGTTTDTPVQGADKKENAAKVRLDLKSVINGVLSGNLELKKASVDYDNAGTDLEKFDGQYDVYVYGKGSKSYRQLAPENPAIVNDGYRVAMNTGEAGLQKHFITGTTVQANVSTTRQAITPSSESKMQLKGYSSAFNVGLSQELLKNTFGSNERKAERSLEMYSEIQQRAARQAVSDAVMNSIIAYWNAIIAEENMKTATIAYNNSKDIRNLVRRKSLFGLSEKEELMDWEGRVLQFKNMQDGAQLGLTDSRLAILRALDFDRSTDIELVQDLVTVPPSVTYAEAMKTALKNRTDLANLRAALAISENQYDMSKNNMLPSVTASAWLGYNDYDHDSLTGSMNTINRQWNVALTVSKALGGGTDAADERNAKNAFLKKKIELKQLESGIADEIRVRIDMCDTAYKIYSQTTQSSEYARLYYESIYRKFAQGRYETTQLKLAFDNYIMLRNNA
ncbi:MAG TPA: TolC family protein, partial [Spirochaetota bacterium]